MSLVGPQSELSKVLLPSPNCAGESSKYSYCNIEKMLADLELETGVLSSCVPV